MPSVAALEAANTLRKRHLRDRRFTRKHFEQSVQDLVDLPLNVVNSMALVREAVDLSKGLSIYDATYAALARELNCLLVTFDGPLEREARRLGIEADHPGGRRFEEWLQSFGGS